MIRLLVVLACLSAAPVYAQETTCVWFGDSISSRVPQGRVEDLAVRLIENDYNISIRNMSSPGAGLGLPGGMGLNPPWPVDTISHISGYQNTVSCIVITAGTNDFGNASSTWDRAHANLTALLNWARANGKKVLMADLIWRGQAETSTATWSGFTWPVYRYVRNQACQNYADVCTFVVRPASFNTARPELFDANEAPNALTHPNAAGQRELANWLGPAGHNAGLW